MTGVSYMIPFVAAGGLLIALSFLLGGYEIVDHARDIVDRQHLLQPARPRGPRPGPRALRLRLLRLPRRRVLRARRDRLRVPRPRAGRLHRLRHRRPPRHRPRLRHGRLAIDLGGFGTPQSGFLGGIVGGVLAGVDRRTGSPAGKVPTWARGLMPVLVIPLLATLIAGFIMLVVLGKPLGRAHGPRSTTASPHGRRRRGILLGIVLGLMMAFDMGGPLNKTAYLLRHHRPRRGRDRHRRPAAEHHGRGHARRHGAAAGAGAGLRASGPVCSPPPERENGKAGWLLGASFITEGAIPFAAADPLRVIPPIMAGSAVTGALAMGLDVGAAGPARRHLRAVRRRQHRSGSSSPWSPGTLVAAAGVIALKSLTEDSPRSSAKVAV